MDIDVNTKLCGIIGYPLEHSLSPAIHNAAALYCKINAVFLAFPTLDVKGAVSAMRVLGMRNLTVTMPHKETVFKYIDKISREALEIGSVNTVINTNGVLKGYNTDIYGIRMSLKGLRLKGKNVVLLGAGGAAKTVLYVLHKKGCKVYVLNRDVKQGKSLARRFNAEFCDISKVNLCVKELKPYLVINATPVGMDNLKGKSLVSKDVLKNVSVVFDLIYNPKKTKLLKDAESLGCKIINGKTMFLWQGARQFELWSRKKAPFKVMERVFDNSF